MLLHLFVTQLHTALLLTPSTRCSPSLKVHDSAEPRAPTNPTQGLALDAAHAVLRFASAAAWLDERMNAQNFIIGRHVTWLLLQP